jgi:hypothetical protein
VKKIKFSTTSYTSRGPITLIFSTGRINNNPYIQTDTSSILTTVPPLSIHEFDENLKINIGDQVFIDYNSGTTAFTFNIAGMNTSPSSSYYFSILRTFSNVSRTYQNNRPFYFESLIEYSSDINLSDVQTEINK